jgi:hypothetical protein
VKTAAELRTTDYQYQRAKHHLRPRKQQTHHKLCLTTFKAIVDAFAMLLLITSSAFDELLDR